MTFKAYHSIKNMKSDRFFNDIVRVSAGTKFIVTEKIHGTNFSVIITKDGINFAKRTSILEADESFFGFQLVMKPLMPIFNRIKESGRELTIFGELAGGSIQRGTEYGDKHFYVFDILENNEFLNADETVEFTKEMGLLHVPVVGIIDFKDVVDLNPNFKTLIPQLLAKPDGDIEYNMVYPEDKSEILAEGFVIKPVKTTNLHDNSRIILKLKSEQHSECKPARNKSLKIKEKLSENDLELLGRVDMYLNENRINSAVSKLGEPTFTFFSAYLNEIKRDILNDVTEDGINIVNEADNPSLIYSELVRNITDALRAFLTKVI